MSDDLGVAAITLSVFDVPYIELVSVASDQAMAACMAVSRLAIAIVHVSSVDMT